MTGQAGATQDKMKLTEAMIEAGVEGYLIWQNKDDYSLRRLVIRVYRAMWEAAQKAPQQD